MQHGIAIVENYEPMVTREERLLFGGIPSRTDPKLIEMMLSGQLANKGVVVHYMSQAHFNYGCWNVVEYNDREYLELDDEKLELYLLLGQIAKCIADKEYDKAYTLAVGGNR